MRRKLLTIVAALSLVLSAAAAILWVRSYWRADVIAFRAIEAADGGAITHRSRQAVSSSGRLSVAAGTTQHIPTGAVGPRLLVVRASPQSQGWSYGVSPAPFAFPRSTPQFDALGVRGAWRPEREMDGRNYNMPGTRARTGGMFLDVPHWLVVLIGLALPAWWWLLRRRGLLRLHRLSHGLCVSCGYDLRESPPGGRCPECGTVPAEPPHNPPMQRTATASSGAVE
jgi:hypothetical protein